VYFRVCGEKKGEGGGGGVKLEGEDCPEEYPNKLEGNVVNLERGEVKGCVEIGEGEFDIQIWTWKSVTITELFCWPPHRVLTLLVALNEAADVAYNVYTWSWQRAGAALRLTPWQGGFGLEGWAGLPCPDGAGWDRVDGMGMGETCCQCGGLVWDLIGTACVGSA
jgi:hypothetical protein